MSRPRPEATPAARVAPESRRRFREAYAGHRAAEGRALTADAARRLPYVDQGPLAAEWAVRARTFERFLSAVLRPSAASVAPRPLELLDLGAGNGWLCHRARALGHRATALDIRTDAVDGLGAAALFTEGNGRLFSRVAADFGQLPFAPHSFDLLIFNASLHYALDLAAVLEAAVRALRPGGGVVVLDSPFYRRDRDGRAMVAEKRIRARDTFGERAEALTALPFIEYLTRDRLRRASEGLGLRWRRHRVRYPLWYELRPIRALLRGERRPSRFDLWEARTS